MTKSVGGKTFPLLLLTMVTTGALGLTGCTSSASATASRSGTTTAKVASTTTAGHGKGHWEDEPTVQTGTFLHRRIWVPDDGSAPVETPAGPTQVYNAPRLSSGLGGGNGRGYGGGGQ